MAFLSIQYMPSIVWMAIFLKHEHVELDVFENYQKMSLRNRCEILGPNGLLKLSVPLTHGRNQRRPVKEVEVKNEESWQKLHWKTLQSCYRRSPYFEYYEPILEKFFESRFHSLLDLDLASIHLILKMLKCNTELHLSKQYSGTEKNNFTSQTNSGITDFPTLHFPIYTQVFSDRLEFVKNLSMLDLLFCEGPKSSMTYLQELQKSL